MRVTAVLIAVLLIAPAFAVDVYVGGTYTGSDPTTPLTETYGAEAQLRLPIAGNLQLGIGAGYERIGLQPDKNVWSKRCITLSNETVGDVKNIPLGVSLLYTIDLGDKGWAIIGEAGAEYNVMDYDVYENQSVSMCGWSQGSSSQVEGLGNVWTAPVGAYLRIPLGKLGLQVGGGYQFQIDKLQHGRFMENAFGKIGLIIPLS